MITYKIENVLPKQFFMRVRYSKDGELDFHKNFNPRDFSEANLHEIAASGVEQAQRYWADAALQPESVVLAEVESTVKEIAREDQPVYDPNTQYLTESVIETATQKIYGWAVNDYTAQELADRLATWRERISVSNRQARLALLQQDMLASVEAAIAALPESQKTLVQIEWEKAGMIDRTSPWIAGMTQTLGLTEEQMDDLFKLAATL